MTVDQDERICGAAGVPPHVAGLREPPLRDDRLDVGQWVICIVFASAVLWTTEIEKFFLRRAEQSTTTELETVSAAGVAM